MSSGINWSGANMSGADLSKADLFGANLSKADLSGANLSEATLSKANLSKADLSGADLSWADLSKANLFGANLFGANLFGATLSKANLSKADLSEANLSGADLSEANLATFIIPRVPNLDKEILAAIEHGGKLIMSTWHTCNTAHCRAGWAIHLAGVVGTDLERQVGSSAAGALIYAVSRPRQRVPDFLATTSNALASIRKDAETA